MVVCRGASYILYNTIELYGEEARRGACASANNKYNYQLYNPYNWAIDAPRCVARSAANNYTPPGYINQSQQPSSFHIIQSHTPAIRSHIPHHHLTSGSKLCATKRRRPRNPRHTHTRRQLDTRQHTAHASASRLCRTHSAAFHRLAKHSWYELTLRACEPHPRVNPRTGSTQHTRQHHDYPYHTVRLSIVKRNTAGTS